ncbi:MAG: phospho-N-acetylmuramoyl-pentapeptide-transferase [Clostridia bacterium]|nr:phospho-N-acetylmuramoyl-pentapeptide-transferase [Clostridia bacterium]
MTGERYIEYAAVFVAVLVFTVLATHLLIPVLQRRHAGQRILEIGPAWHLSKAGTPTMGGLAFIFAIVGVGVLYGVWLLRTERAQELRLFWTVLVYALACGAIGVADDACKLLKKQNQGLTAPQKYLLQLLASAIFLLLARRFCGVSTVIRLPFGGAALDLGFFYYPLALLFLTGLVNALNLTDGLDGLLSVNVAVMGGFFLLLGLRDRLPISALSGVMLLGAALGFLLFNRHPAKVFMGDTGSLFFGGFVAALGIVTAHPLAVLIAGAVFVWETLSVILQVVYFKCTGGKRLFRMAPFHHHLEKCGLREGSIVALSLAVSVFLAGLAYFGG